MSSDTTRGFPTEVYEHFVEDTAKEVLQRWGREIQDIAASVKNHPKMAENGKEGAAILIAVEIYSTACANFIKKTEVLAEELGGKLVTQPVDK